MIAEHWIYEDGSAIFPKEDHDIWMVFYLKTGSTPVQCCEIEGQDWEDCMRKYHEHMGWEPYVPFDEDHRSC